jgi:hypothetical protein
MSVRTGFAIGGGALVKVRPGVGGGVVVMDAVYAA